MLTQDRHIKILSILKENGSVTVSRLTEELNTSESTIRRDLAHLADIGKLNKVHGGATVLNQEFIKIEDSLDSKLTKNIEEKRLIAKYAAQQVKDDDFVYIDAGTTTLLMTQFLKDSQATFITNGISHAKTLSENGCKVLVLGGLLKPTTEAIIGLKAASNLQQYSFTKAFMGANGVSEKQGFTTPDIEEATLKAVAIEKSFVSYVLADSSKFDKVSAVKIGSLDTACIITDKCTNEKIKKLTVVKEVIK